MSTLLSTGITAVLESLSDAALVIDRQGRIVFANALAEPLFGYTSCELMGRAVEELVPVQERSRHVRERMQAAAAREVRRMGSGLSLAALRADGSTVPVDISLAPIGDDGAFTLACVRDMTGYAQLLHAAEKAEDRYRMVVDSASEVFYRVRVEAETLRGTVEFVSPQCQRITARRADEFLANPALWLESVHPDDRPVLFQTTQEILRNGVEGSRYYRLRNHATGEYRWVADRVVPLHDEHGRMTGYQGVARDITERRRSEEERQRLAEELRRAQKMEAIGRLAGGVAHDFNNLVTVILASCDAAREQMGGNSPVDAHLTEIVDAGQRAAELTRQLLTLSHEQPGEPRVLDMNATLAASKALLRRMLPETVEFRWLLADSVWPVRLDDGHLDQIVFNLTANARDAMPDGGTFTAETRNVTSTDELFISAGGLLPGDYVQLSILDTGIGMDEATIAHAFEPFYTTKPTGQGTGLGLASVYALVKQHHGDIQIDSVPGRGTRVVIHFPRCRATA